MEPQQKKIGGWKDTSNFTVGPLRLFQGRLRDRVLGYQTKAVPTPYLGTLGIMDEGRPGMIPFLNVKTSVPTLSALSRESRDEETFVAHNPPSRAIGIASLDFETRLSFLVVILPGRRFLDQLAY